MIPTDASPGIAAVTGRLLGRFPLLRRLHAVTRPAADPMPPRSRLRRWLVDVPMLVVVFWNDVFRYALPSVEGTGHAPRWVLLVVGVGVMLSLLVRRTRPTAVLALHAGWTVVLALLVPQGTTSALGLAVALYALAIRRTALWAVGASVGFLLVTGGAEFWHAAHAPADEQWGTDSVMFNVGLDMLVVAVMVAVGRNVTAVRRAEDSAERAVRDERLAIARELHDIVAHAVSIMVLQAAGAKAVLELDPRRAAEALDVVTDTGSQSLDELRRLLHLLRSVSGDPQEAAYPPVSDFGALDALVEQSRAAGLPVEVQVVGDPAVLDPSVGLAAYRLVQEALTNTRKHAGPGAQAVVRVAWSADRLRLTVQNSSPERPAPGAAPAVRSTGVGLIGLRERVATVGGELRAGPVADGFLIEATLPARKRPTGRAATGAGGTGQDVLVSGRTG